MRATTIERFPNYSQEALQKVIRDSVGKPVINGPSGEEIGIIIGAKQIDDSDVIEFEMDLKGVELK